MARDTGAVVIRMTLSCDDFYVEARSDDLGGLREIIMEAIESRLNEPFPILTIQRLEIIHEAVDGPRPESIWSLLGLTRPRGPYYQYVIRLTLVGPNHYTVAAPMAWLTDTIEYLVTIAIVEIFPAIIVEETKLTGE